MLERDPRRLRGMAFGLLLCLLAALPAAGQPAEVTGLRLPDAGTVSWEPAGGAVGYHLYQGDVASLPGSFGSCVAGSITGTSTGAPDVPAAGSALTYLVSAFDGAGEGGLGSGSTGTDRPVNLACVPARRVFPPRANGPAFDGVEDGALAARSGEVIVRGWDPSKKGEIAGVVAATGELIVGATDLTLRGRGLSWSLTRTYRSQVAHDGPLGHGWFLGDGEHLRSDPAGVLHCGGDGSCRTFASGPVGFVSPDGVFAVLHGQADGSFALRHPDGTLVRFHPLDGSPTSGALSSREDRTGAKINYLYDAQGLLTTVVDTLGHSVSFEYDAAGRLTRVTDFDSRTVSYGYDAAGNLTSVTSPPVTGTPNGNDFPSGKTTIYSYSAGFADDRLNHNLETITDPLGQTWYSSVFSSTPDEPATGALTFDRVVSQDIGGTNASGVPAGGAVSLSYDALNPGADPGLADLPRRRATVTDPNGTTVEHTTNAGGHELTHLVHQRGVRPGDPPTWVTEYRYDRDGLLQQLDRAGGNSLIYTYDQAGADRYRQGNLLEVRRIADPARGDGHGAAAGDLVVSYEYEPLYNRVTTVVDPRGNDSAYVPQNGGAWSAARYTTKLTYDWQEGDPATNGANDYAARWGISLAGAATGLGDVNGDSTLDAILGSLVRRENPAVNLDPAGRQAAVEGDPLQQIDTLYRHNALGQLTAIVDPTGAVTSFAYHPETDPDGDGVPSAPPADGRRLDALDGGFVRSMTDALGGRRETSYDPRGNPTSTSDPRGVADVRVFNQLDQLVETRNGAATADASGPAGDPPTGYGESGLTAPGYLTRYEYDANDNIVRVSNEDRGDERGLGGWVETSWTYDALDRVVRTTESAAPGVDLATELRYDGNGNTIREISPAGTETGALYDERDLLYQATLGAAGPFGGSPATISYTYDGNANLVRADDPLGRITSYVYDGHDRLVRQVDEVGGAIELFYDPDSAIVRALALGTVGGASPTDRSGASNVTLGETLYLYDEAGRPFRIDRALGMPSGASTARPPSLSEGPLVSGDGLINETLEYDAAGRLTFVTGDHGSTEEREYDALGRLVRRAEPDRGSETLFTLDAAGLLIEAEEIETDAASGVPTPFLTTWFYDALGRETMIVDNTGAAHRFVWDSLSALSSTSDPLGPPGGTVNRRSPAHAAESVAINAHGNVTRYAYDGIDRLISLSHVLTASGRGDGTLTPPPDTSNPHNPSGEIRVSYEYDGLSRLTRLTDAGGFDTTYAYDNLDRLITTTGPGGGGVSRTYDTAGNVSTVTDELLSVLTFSYDNAHRPVQLSVSPAAGVEGTTLQTFEYDGLGRVTRATDNNIESNPDDDSEVLFSYDLLGRLVEEQQRVPGLAPFFAVDYAYEAAGRISSMTWPTGDVANYGYDAGGRLTSIVDPAVPGANVDLSYAGPRRIVSRSGGTSLTATATYDAARRIVSLEHQGGGAPIGGFSYTYDDAGRVLSELRTHDASGDLRRGVKFERDSAGRFDASTEAMYTPALSVSGTPDDEVLWTLDAAGNAPQQVRNGTTLLATPNNLSRYDEMQCCGTSTDDGLLDDFGDDAATPAADGRNFAHDASGNQTLTGELRLVYDALHRPVRAYDDLSGSPVARYRYDALGRLAQRTIVNAGSPNEHRMRLHAGWRLIEERDETSSLRRRVAITPFGAPLWQVRAGASPQAEHLLANALSSTALLAAPDGAVLERMTYGATGQPLFLDPSNKVKKDSRTGAPLARSDFDVGELLRGRTYLHELGNRSATPEDDWAGAYFHEGAFFDPNQLEMLGGGRQIDRGGGLWPGATRNGAAALPQIGDEVLIGLGHARAVDGGGLMDGEEDTNRNRQSLLGFGAGSSSGRAALAGRDSGGGAPSRAPGHGPKFKAGAELSKKVNIAAPGPGGDDDPPYIGHVTVVRAASVAGGPYKTHGHVTVLKLAGAAPPGPGGGRHRGHVTVLKLAGGHPPEPGHGAQAARHRGHVTVLKAAGGESTGEYVGHVTVLKLSGAANGGSVSGGAGGAVQLMNKAELIESVGADANLSKADSKRALEALATGSGAAMKKGDRIALVGFGSFGSTGRRARTGRNPQTGKEIKIAAKNVVKFKAGAALAKKVNIAPPPPGGGSPGGAGRTVDSFFDVYYDINPDGAGYGGPLYQMGFPFAFLPAIPPPRLELLPLEDPGGPVLP